METENCSRYLSTYFATCAIWCKVDIVVFIWQPSIDTGNVGGIGLGCPKATQNRKTNDAKAAVTDPVSVADSVSIPSVKSPKSGPPTTPNMVRLTYNNSLNRIQ